MPSVISFELLLGPSGLIIAKLFSDLKFETDESSDSEVTDELDVGRDFSFEVSGVPFDR